MQQLAISASTVGLTQPLRPLFIKAQYNVVIINKTGEKRIFEALEKQYNLVKVYSNELGIENTLTIIPSLVLIVTNRVTDTDIKDMCWIKGNSLCSHIPIVVVASEISNQKQIDCLQAGIDAIFQMAIDKKVLSAQINALIKGREHLKAVYKQNEGRVKDIDNESFDRTFLKRAHQIVIDNYTKSSFNIDQFVKLMNVSRTMLYVKIKKLTNKTTSEFVRDIRLEEAARLLKQGVLNVSEVAFTVGFNDPKYLSKKFKQKFGITPAVFRRGKASSDDCNN